MALLPPIFIKCVAAIGNRQPTGDVRWVATGFFYGSPTPSPTQFRAYLVTNRHVAVGLTNGVVRLNSSGTAPPREFELQSHDPDGNPLWFYHTDTEVDVAITPVNVNFSAPENEELGFFAGEFHALTSSQMLAQQMQEGDPVFLLGFPMGWVGSNRNAVIVRGGHIARLRDLFDGANKSFLVDSWVFPGNSGGPVVSRPEATSIVGTVGHDRSDLIGIVAQYVPYSDVAVSQQTGHPRVVFEENSGLAIVFPVECIQSIITDFEAKHPLPISIPTEITEVPEDPPPDL